MVSGFALFQILTDFLEKYKFPVERNFVCDTGFRSEYNDVTKPNIAVLCEYDALPDIGHACGHNLIAEVGVGAAIGIKAALDVAAEVGQKLGKVRRNIANHNEQIVMQCIIS